MKKLLGIPVLVVVLILSLSLSGLLITNLSSVTRANAQQLDQKPLVLTNANRTNPISSDVDSRLQNRLLEQRTLMQNLFNSTGDRKAEQSNPPLSIQTDEQEPSAGITVKSSSKGLAIQQQTQCNNFPHNFECTIDANPGEPINLQISCFADSPDIIVQCVEVQHIPGSVFDASPPGNPTSATFAWEKPGPSGTYVESMKAQIVFCPAKYISCSDSPLSTITIKINSPPKADAGPNMIITRDDILSGKQSVKFDGCSSSDPDNDPLSYAWTLAKPNPDLSAPASLPDNACDPTITIGLTPADDDFGTKLTYNLVVNDGKIDSDPSSVDVTVCPRHDDITPDGKCNLPKIDVRAVKVSEPIPIYHLFIIYTDENGINYLYRGGPSSPFPHYGTIQGYNAVYANGGPDWDLDAPSVTVMKGSVASGKDSCFVSQLSRITSAKIPYHVGGPNSNTVVKTLLLNCGVPVAKPVNVAPGWDRPPL